jgi:hypothetical protein
MPDHPKHDAMMFSPVVREAGPVEPFLTFGIEEEDEDDDESGLRLTN